MHTLGMLESYFPCVCCVACIVSCGVHMLLSRLLVVVGCAVCCLLLLLVVLALLVVFVKWFDTVAS